MKKKKKTISRLSKYDKDDGIQLRFTKMIREEKGREGKIMEWCGKGGGLIGKVLLAVERSD